MENETEIKVDEATGSEAEENLRAAVKEQDSGDDVKKGGKKKFIFLATAVAILFAALLFGGSSGPAVAKVNGEKISKEEYDLRLKQAYEFYQAQGTELGDAETQEKMREFILDELVNETLVLQYAEENNITITPEDKNEVIEALRENAGGDEALMENLKAENLTMEDLNEIVRKQLMIKGAVEHYIVQKNIRVTDTEVEEFFKEYSAAIDDDTVKLDEVRPEIVARMQQLKTQQAILDLVDELKNSADIELLLDTTTKTAVEDSVASPGAVTPEEATAE